MITIVIMDAEVELIPRELWKHPQVRSFSRMMGRPPGQLLLDASFCHAAMRKLEDSDRRGRPDITHRLLLTALDFPVEAEVYVHTRGGMTFYVPPGTRIPKNYFRFEGLFAKLLQGFDGPIIKRVESFSLKPPVYVLDPAGKRVSPEFWHGKTGTFVVGGFPRGGYRTAVEGKKYALVDRELTAPAALGLLLSWIYE